MLHPNLVLVGFPKCVTTSLFCYLADHPEVCSSIGKETYFLMDKGHPLFTKKKNYIKSGLEGYGSFFSRRYNKEKIILESTPDYFYQKTAFVVLQSLIPQPTILFILRNPVERAYSLFQFAKNKLAQLPKNLTFPVFIKNIRISKDFLANRPVLRNTIEHGKYINYVRPCYENFGKNKMLILLFEDMRDNPIEFMKRLSISLSIEQNLYNNYVFEIRKPKVPTTVRLLLSKIFNSLYLRWNKNNLVEKDMRSFQSLRNEYQPFNEELSKIFNVNISPWI